MRVLFLLIRGLSSVIIAIALPILEATHEMWYLHESPSSVMMPNNLNCIILLMENEPRVIESNGSEMTDLEMENFVLGAFSFNMFAENQACTSPSTVLVCSVAISNDFEQIIQVASSAS